MKRLWHGYTVRSILPIAAALGAAMALSACEEANLAVDNILGRRTPVLSASSKGSPSSLVPAMKKSPGDPAPPPGAAPAGVSATPSSVPAPAAQATAEGKRRAPGESLSPTPPKEVGPAVPKGPRDLFVVTRDPFRAPTEILPSECPPSMPLCRFDRAQLKLVGVIQVGEGQFKALVEDPDGRGYFITPGMQIGKATVTQVTNKGVTLHEHRTRQDVVMPLFREGSKETTGDL